MSISEHKHMPEPVRRIEVFTGAGRRRSWSGEEKAAIIAESYAGDEDGEIRSGALPLRRHKECIMPANNYLPVWKVRPAKVSMPGKSGTRPVERQPVAITT